MVVKVNVKRTEPKKLKVKKRKREWKPKKGTLHKIIGAVLEVLFILTIILGFLWATFIL